MSPENPNMGSPALERPGQTSSSGDHAPLIWPETKSTAEKVPGELPQITEKTEKNPSVDDDAVPAGVLKAAAEGQDKLKDEDFYTADARVRMIALLMQSYVFEYMAKY